MIFVCQPFRNSSPMIRLRTHAPAAPMRIDFLPPIRSASGPLKATARAYVQKPAVAMMPKSAFDRWNWSIIVVDDTFRLYRPM